MNLVVGSTGLLGRRVCRQLRAAGRPVRALVRPTSARETVRELEQLGVELFAGDLKAPDRLQAACEGIDTVISTASSTLSRQSGDSIESVDLRGHLHLIDAARRASVAHFVFVSFYKQALNFPLQTAKRAIEDELQGGGINYTIFQPVDMMEVWLGPALGFDPAAGKARVYGDGNRPFSWISLENVASFVAGAVGNKKALNRTFPLGGPEALTAMEVVRIFEESRGAPIEVAHVLESDLMGQFETATDPLARSFAALMLETARGCVVTSDAALDAIPISLTSVRTYAEQLLGRPKTDQ